MSIQNDCLKDLLFPFSLNQNQKSQIKRISSYEDIFGFVLYSRDGLFDRGHIDHPDGLDTLHGNPADGSFDDHSLGFVEDLGLVLEMKHIP